jgi:hypothetical protein
MTGSFLHEPPVSPRVQALYDDDLAGDWRGAASWAQRRTLPPRPGS